MKCPDCGAQIKEGMLLCQGCGRELKLIPDFEPEIENKINDTLSDISHDASGLDLIDLDVVAEIKAESDPADPGSALSATKEFEGMDSLPEIPVAEEDYSYEEEDPENEELDEFDEEYDGDDYIYNLDEFEEDEDVARQLFLAFRESKLRWLYLLIFLVLLVFAVRGIMKLSENIYEDNSQSYQTRLAKEAAAEGDYPTAIEYMEKALTINSEDTSLKFTLVDYYFENMEDEKALLMLWEIIYAGDVNSRLAYKRMIDYYAARKDYVRIEQILSGCQDSAVLTQFNEYLANPPEFSETPGTYDSVIWLKLSANSNGSIYYTLDGTEPTTSSELYTSPVYFELGIYEINAIFINSYGIKSDVATGLYTIDIRKPDSPMIEPEEGEYESPELITAEAQKFCRIYYTTDGTEPTDESTEYLGPVPMPIGHSHFIFVAYSQEGVPGEISEAEYDLLLQPQIEAWDYITAIQQYNMNIGKTTDTEGHMPGSSSRFGYNVTAAISFEDDEDHIYYIITENMTDSSEASIKTGVYYLGEINEMLLYKAVRDEEDMSFSMGAEISPADYAAPEPVITEEEPLP